MIDTGVCLSKECRKDNTRRHDAQGTNRRYGVLRLGQWNVAGISVAENYNYKFRESVDSVTKFIKNIYKGILLDWQHSLHRKSRRCSGGVGFSLDRTCILSIM